MRLTVGSVCIQCGPTGSRDGASQEGALSASPYVGEQEQRKDHSNDAEHLTPLNMQESGGPLPLLVFKKYCATDGISR